MQFSEEELISKWSIIIEKNISYNRKLTIACVLQNQVFINDNLPFIDKFFQRISIPITRRIIEKLYFLKCEMGFNPFDSWIKTSIEINKNIRGLNEELDYILELTKKLEDEIYCFLKKNELKNIYFLGISLRNNKFCINYKII